MKSIPTYILSKGQSDAIASIAEKIVEYDPLHYSDFTDSCNEQIMEMPNDLKMWISAKRHFNCLLLKNLPVEDNLPATPTERFQVDATSMVSDKIVGLFSQLFGSIYTFEGKSTPRHIHNVYPTFGEKDSQLGFSKIELEWHVEDGFHEDRPDWVGLFCLRGDRTVVTKIARCIDILQGTQLPEIVYNNQFDLRVDDSFISEKHETYVKTKIIINDTQGPQIVFDPYYTKTNNDEEASILELIKEKAMENQFSVILEKGDFLFFDNRRTIHSRSAYSPKMNGSDRWVKRVLILDQKKAYKLNSGYLSFNQ